MSVFSHVAKKKVVKHAVKQAAAPRPTAVKYGRRPEYKHASRSVSRSQAQSQGNKPVQRSRQAAGVRRATKQKADLDARYIVNELLDRHRHDQGDMIQGLAGLNGRTMFGQTTKINEAHFLGDYDRLFKEVKRYLPKGAEVPRAELVTDNVADNSVGVPYDGEVDADYKRKDEPVHLRWSLSQDGDKDTDDSTIAHEWAHVFQNRKTLESKHLRKTGNGEGEAEAFAQDVMKKLHRKHVPDSYDKFVAEARKHPAFYRRGQFR